MKRLLKIFGVLILLILIALVAAPFLFKDKIKAAVQKETNESLDAEVYFGDVGLSFIKNFPQACITIHDFGVLGKEPFAGDTLIQGKQFELVVDIMSIISGEKIQLNKVGLIRPKIKALVLTDGRANWEIIKDTGAEPDSAVEASFVVDLDKYEIQDGNIYYSDATSPMVADIRGLNHSGNGNFTEKDFIFETETKATSVTVSQGGVRYLNGVALDADVDMNITNGDPLHIRLLNNLIRINDLAVGIDGTVDLAGSDINIDLAFEAKETAFKSILSLVPGAYTKDFKDVKTDGTLSLNGKVKGTYNEKQLPGFAASMKVDNGSFQYPDLPTAVTGIHIDMDIDEPDGTFNRLKMDIRNFKANFGKNPLEGKAKIQGIGPVRVTDGVLKGNIDLAEITTMFPIEGTDLKGQLVVDATANGVYDEKKNAFPSVNAVLKLTDGYVKYAEYPAEIKRLNIDATLKDASQDMKLATFDMPRFYFEMDAEPIEGSLKVRDFSDPQYDLKAKGILDLDKITQLFPIEGMKIGGKVALEDISAQGRLSQIEKEQYTQLKTSGKARITNLTYDDGELPPVKVTSGTGIFTSDKLVITSAVGTLGRSDFSGSGYLDNYLAYGLMPNQKLSGAMNVKSKKFDADEWMEEEEGAAAPTGTPPASAVVPIPGDLNIDMNVEADEVLYDGMVLKGMKGKLKVADEAVAWSDTKFNFLGSFASLNGSYNTRNVKKPFFDIKLDLKNLNVQNAYQGLETFKKYAPISKLIEGVANTSFTLTGNLGEDLMPILEDLTSIGVFEMVKGSVADLKVMNKVASLTKLESLKKLDVSGVKGQFFIENGFLNVKPFDIKLKDMTLTLGGRQNITGDLEYALAIDMPAGKAGNAALGALSDLAGGKIKTSDRVHVDLKVGGTLTDPKVTGLKSSTADDLKDQVVETAKDELESKIKDKTGVDVKVPTSEADLKAAAEKARKRAEDSVRQVVEKARKRAEDSVKRVIEIEKQKAAQKAKEELEKQLGNETKNALDSLKDKVKIPWPKKKN